MGQGGEEDKEKVDSRRGTGFKETVNKNKEGVGTERNYGGGQTPKRGCEAKKEESHSDHMFKPSQLC